MEAPKPLSLVTSRMEPSGVVGENPTWKPVQQLGIQHLDHKILQADKTGKWEIGKGGSQSEEFEMED